MSGEVFDARESQGAVSGVSGSAEFNQNFGDHRTDTGGGDAAGGNLDKSTTNNFIVINGEQLSSDSQQLQQLIQLLGKDNRESIRQAYQEALPADSYVSRPSATNNSEMLAQLQEFRKLSEFLDRLIQDNRTPQAIRDQLKDKFSEERPLEKPRNPAREAPLQSHLQIVLRADSSATDRFLMNAWLIPDETVQETAHRFQPLDIDVSQKGVSCSLEEVPNVLSEFLNLSLKALIGRRYELTIEIFLPLNQLCAEADSWKISDDLGYEDELIAIGERYRVIVRSCDRLDPKYLASRLNQWYANWDRVKASWDGIPDHNDFEHLSQLENCNWKRLANSLSQKLGLKLTCGLAETSQKEFFTAILRAATPIAIWVRRDLPHFNQADEIDTLLTTAPLLALADSILKIRRTAGEELEPEMHLGAHLAILWEDPFRLTPDAMAQLIEPGQ